MVEDAEKEARWPEVLNAITVKRDFEQVQVAEHVPINLVYFLSQLRILQRVKYRRTIIIFVVASLFRISVITLSNPYFTVFIQFLLLLVMVKDVQRLRAVKLLRDHVVRLVRDIAAVDLSQLRLKLIHSLA